MGKVRGFLSLQNLSNSIVARHVHKYILHELCAGVSDYLINYLSINAS